MDKNSHIEPLPRNLTNWMRSMSIGINRGIEKHGIVKDPKHGKIYAYEVDGYGCANIMDDRNVPSLLSAPFLGYTTLHDPIYQNTRRKILFKDNPDYAWVL
jgi:meiotically up-regulated gene 157 (Mug157) protein